MKRKPHLSQPQEMSPDRSEESPNENEEEFIQEEFYENREEFIHEESNEDSDKVQLTQNLQESIQEQKRVFDDSEQESQTQNREECIDEENNCFQGPKKIQSNEKKGKWVQEESDSERSEKEKLNLVTETTKAKIEMKNTKKREKTYKEGYKKIEEENSSDSQVTNKKLKIDAAEIHQSELEVNSGRGFPEKKFEQPVSKKSNAKKGSERQPSVISHNKIQKMPGTDDKLVEMATEKSQKCVNEGAQKREIEEMSELEDKAYLASQIITLICKNNPHQFLSWKRTQSQQLKELTAKVKEKSLAMRIVDMIRQLKVSKGLNASSANYMESIFTTGVEYDDLIFNQVRTKEGENQSSSKFTFLPTYTVTSAVFNHIIHKSKLHRILTGHYGISKSISVMLYAILSGIIAQYKIKTHLPKQVDAEQKKNQKIKEINSRLRFKSEIKNYPKLLYYNYSQTGSINNNTANYKKKDVHKIFLRQSGLQNTETQNFYIKPDPKNQPFTLFEYFQSKGIDLVVCFDQFNKLISLGRQMINLQKKQKLNRISQSEKSKLILKKQFISEFKTVFDQIRKRVGNLFFLSSVCYQQSVVQQLRLGPNGNHSDLSFDRIKYIEIVNEDFSTYELVDSVLFLLEQKNQIKLSDLILQEAAILQPTQAISLKKKNQRESQENQKNGNQVQTTNSDSHSKLRSFLFNELKQYKENHALNFYEMRKSIFKIEHSISNQKFQQAVNQKSFESVKASVKQLLHMFINDSLKHLKKKYKEFLKEREDKQHDSKEDLHRFQTCLYLSALQTLKSNPEQRGRNFQLKFQEQLLPLSNPEYIQKLVQKHLVQVKEQSQQTKIYCLVPPKFLIEMMDDEIGKSFNYVVRNKILLISRYLNTSGMGGMTEKVFVDMMAKEKVNIKILLNQRDKKYSYLNTKKKNYFRQIPRSYLKQENAEKNILQRIKQKRQIFEKIIKESQDQLNHSGQKNNQTIKKLPLAYNLKEQLKGALLQQINKIKVNNEIILHTLLFVPQTLTPKDQSLSNGTMMDSAKSNDNFSKAIDFILVNVVQFQNINKITINAIDITVSMKKTTQKIMKFLEEFCCFEDRYTDHLQLMLQGQEKATKFDTELNYFVFAPGNYNHNLAQKLNENFGKLIKFTKLPGKEDLFQVENNEEKTDSMSKEEAGRKLFLKNVGFLKIGESIVVNKVETNPQSLSQESYYETWKEMEKQLIAYEFKKRKEKEAQAQEKQKLQDEKAKAKKAAQIKTQKQSTPELAVLVKTGPELKSEPKIRSQSKARRQQQKGEQ